jgi:predicted 3-demethylubiquinone-9 3-methyltransferase (glyoxalase superfamily)
VHDRIEHLAPHPPGERLRPGHVCGHVRSVATRGDQLSMSDRSTTMAAPTRCASRKEPAVQKIVPSLWFDTQAEEAADFYVSIFENSRIVEVARYGSAGPRPEGTVMTVDFELAGQRFNALNGGPDFTFTEATSLIVNCETQDEVDRLWETLSQGGEPGPCGWIKDRFGFSWQIVPIALGEMLSDPDHVKAQRAMAAMLQMSKIDVDALGRAFEGEEAPADRS